MIYLGADHAGFKLKGAIKKYLKQDKVAFVDCGAKKYNPQDDFPDFTEPVAKKVSQSPLKDLGILFCGSGQCMAVVANKFKNVRAITATSAAEAKHNKEHIFANILSLPSEMVSPQVAINIVESFIHTKYPHEQRHLRRLEKIGEIEKKLYK